VSLSGGGFRATVFAMGALLALVDRGLNREIDQIASVSGGSIASAFTAAHVELSELNPGDLDASATELLSKIARGRVLTRWAFSSFLVVAVALTTLATFGAARLGTPTPVLVFLALVIVGGCALTLGKVVQAMLGRAFLRPDGYHIKLGDLTPHGIEYVFCATDLIEGMPVYASTHDAQLILRAAVQAGWTGLPETETRLAPDLTLEEIVRASAAFPGIAPRLLRLRESRFPLAPPSEESESEGVRDESRSTASRTRTLILADGGLWNNLGTQMVREEQRVLGQDLQDWAPHPTVLIINAAAPTRRVRPFVFLLPVIASVTTVIRSMQLLLTSSVGSRVDTARWVLYRRLAEQMSGQAPYNGDDLVVNMDTAAETRESLESVALPAEQVFEEFETLSVRYWREDLERLIGELLWKEDVQGLTKGPDSTRKEALLESIRDHMAQRPVRASTSEGVVTTEQLRGLCDADWWMRLETLASEAMPAVATSLSRLPQRLLLQYLARGYANTLLTSLFICPISDQEQQTLAAVDPEKRLRTMAASAGIRRRGSRLGESYVARIRGDRTVADSGQRTRLAMSKWLDRFEDQLRGPMSDSWNVDLGDRPRRLPEVSVNADELKVGDICTVVADDQPLRLSALLSLGGEVARYLNSRLVIYSSAVDDETLAGSLVTAQAGLRPGVFPGEDPEEWSQVSRALSMFGNHAYLMPRTSRRDVISSLGGFLHAVGRVQPVQRAVAEEIRSIVVLDDLSSCRRGVRLTVQRLRSALIDEKAIACVGITTRRYRRGLLNNADRVIQLGGFVMPKRDQSGSGGNAR